MSRMIMQRNIYFALILIVSVAMTGKASLISGENDIQEYLLREAAILITKSKYASYPQYDYKDVILSFKEADGLQELHVKMNQVRNNPEGRFYFSEFSETQAIVAVEWAEGYDRNYVYSYSVIFAKMGDQWTSITESSYLTGHVEKEIDLDGDGSDELILKESTVNKANNEFGGKYRLAYQNPEGNYEIYWYIHLGSYGSRNTGETVNEETVKLDYLKENNRTIIISTLLSGQDTQPVTGKFSWNGFSLEMSNPEEVTHLTIEGVDIWVRDAPVSGKVVMKLNEGDKCRILGKTGFEIIRGMADWWYQIEFEGQTGWVFGSQTDVKHFVQLVDQYVDFWDFYWAGLKYECREQSIAGIFSEEPGVGCCYEEISNNSFVITHNNEDGYISDQHSLRKILKNELALVSVRSEIGAAMLSTSYSTRAAWFTKSAWNMRLSSRLDGVLDTLYRMNDEKYLVFTRTIDYIGSEFGLMGMQTSTKWNVYLFDITKSSPFEKIQVFGEFEISSDEVMSKNDGEVFTDSLGIDFNFDSPSITLVLKEYKRKVYGDTFMRMLNLTGETTYYWDEQAMKFIQQ